MEKQKYKILFADDEYWSREKIRRMIPWEEYGLEFLEPAEDGETVLQRMEESRVDILITDINMPFLNGVDLLAQVQNKYPEVITFVISGYDDFDYVKGTFMAGATNYLKKPVSKVELVNAVVKAVEIIGEREHEKLQHMRAASLIEDREFSAMIQKDKLSFVPAVSVNDRDIFVGTSLVLIMLHNMQEVIQKNQLDVNLFSYNIKKRIRRLLEEETAIVFNYIYRSNEFIIVTEKMEKDLLRFAEKVKRFFAGFSCACITICISGRSYTLESIHMAYVEAVGLLMTRKFCREDVVVVAGKDGTGNHVVNSRIGNEYGKQLRNLLLAGNRAGAGQMIFETIGLQDCECRGWTYLEVKQVTRQVMNILADYALEEQPKLSDFENIIESVDKKTEELNIQELCDMVKEIILYIMPGKEIAATDSMRDIVRKAVMWVDDHYAEEVTLASLAERYHVENSYFSRIFRQEMGISLILYITRKRMEKAKEYIRGSEMSLMEIAFMTGYDDYTYFSRVFKKNTGMSPREYRDHFKEEKK